MLVSEIFAWLGAFILIAVTLFFMVFGKQSADRKYQKIFGRTSEILGNKSAVIPLKVLVYTFMAAFFCFFVAAILYSGGY